MRKGIANRYLFNTIFYVVVLLLFFSCHKEEAAKVEAIKLDVNIETVKEVEIIYSDSAMVRVKIIGPMMLYHVNSREPKQEFPNGIQIDFYDVEGKISSTLTGKYGIRYEGEGRAVVQDSVVWRSVAGERLDTEELIWDERTQRVYNHKFVVLRKLDEIIYGQGFEATQDFKYAHVKAAQGRKSIQEISDDFE